MAEDSSRSGGQRRQCAFGNRRWSRTRSRSPTLCLCAGWRLWCRECDISAEHDVRLETWVNDSSGDNSHLARYYPLNPCIIFHEYKAAIGRESVRLVRCLVVDFRVVICVAGGAVYGIYVLQFRGCYLIYRHRAVSVEDKMITLFIRRALHVSRAVLGQVYAARARS